METSSEPDPRFRAELERRLAHAASQKPKVEIDRDAVQRVFERADSVPEVVARSGAGRAKELRDGADEHADSSGLN